MLGSAFHQRISDTLPGFHFVVQPAIVESATEEVDAEQSVSVTKKGLGTLNGSAYPWRDRYPALMLDEILDSLIDDDPGIDGNL